MAINFAFGFHFNSEVKMFSLSRACKSVARMLLLGEVKHRDLKAKRQPSRMTCSSTMVAPDSPDPIPCALVWKKKEIDWSFFRAKRALFWHKEKANYAETDLLEISFYENDNYDCCSYIYKILCLNIWQYYLREISVSPNLSSYFVEYFILVWS